MISWFRKAARKSVAEPRMQAETAIFTDVGCVREVNEDSAACVQPTDRKLLARKGLLAIVADGMGGHAAGEVASRMAVDIIRKAYYEDRAETLPALKKALVSANREIYAASRRDASQAGMGTTCTAIALQDGTAVMAHVGDSRLYLLRDGELFQLSEDHSMMMEMVRRGVLTPEEARHHPDRNIILRALGTRPEVDVAVWEEPFPVREGDCFLLCSDGLYDLVDDEEIRQQLSDHDLPQAGEALITLAKERGGHDNITVVILKLGGARTEETSARPTRDGLEGI